MYRCFEDVKVKLKLSLGVEIREYPAVGRVGPMVQGNL